MEINKLKPFPNHMTRKDKTIILVSKIKSRIFYGLELFLRGNKNILSKLESAIMTVNMWIHGKNNFHTNKEQICNEIGVDTTSQKIMKTALQCLHKTIIKKKSEAPFWINSLY